MRLRPDAVYRKPYRDVIMLPTNIFLQKKKTAEDFSLAVLLNLLPTVDNRPVSRIEFVVKIIIDVKTGNFQFRMHFVAFPLLDVDKVKRKPAHKYVEVTDHGVVENLASFVETPRQRNLCRRITVNCRPVGHKHAALVRRRTSLGKQVCLAYVIELQQQHAALQ